jgi:C_GCAxxG_C_C family probable redox protein
LIRDLVTEAKNAVGNYYRAKYNCAESIIHGFNDVLNLKIDPEMIKMFSGYGGGLGYAGCMCGALSASIAILGYFKGRRTSEEKRDVIYDLSNRFHDCFEEELGATCCRVLNPYSFNTPEHARTCLKITGNTAKILMQFLLAEGLVNSQ